VEQIARVKLFDHPVGLMFRRLHLRESLVMGGIKRLSERLDPLDPCRSRTSRSALMTIWTPSITDSPFLRRTARRVRVINHREDLADQRFRGKAQRLDLFALHPLLEILQLRAFAQETILAGTRFFFLLGEFETQLFALALRRDGSRVFRCRRRRSSILRRGSFTSLLLIVLPKNDGGNVGQRLR